MSTQPQIQYATTADGVGIAYFTIGSGQPVLFLMSPWSNLTQEWEIDYLRQAYAAAAQAATFVRLDPRGFGLSEREPPDFELDSMVMDIEAVVERLGLKGLRILALGLMNIPAIAYTARHQDIVSHLALVPAAASGMYNSERLQKLLELGEVDWELSTNTIVRTFNRDWSEEQVKEFGALIRASIDYEGMGRFSEYARLWNAENDVSAVTTPTLLVHDRQNPDFDLAETRRVAGLIRSSRVAFVSSTLESIVTAQRFLQDLPIQVEREPEPDAAPPGQVCTVLFTDVEGSTALTDRLGDERAREVLREHERIVREALKSHSGSEVKTMGDGFMASFTSVTRAVECAIALQKAFADREGEALSVRVGLNAGEPIEEDGDLFGATVILASRIAAKADGGEILVSDNIRSLSAGKGFLFSDRGEFVAKGFEEPVRVYEVSWRT